MTNRLLFPLAALVACALLAAGCTAEKADVSLTTPKAEALLPQVVQAVTVTLKDRRSSVVTTGTLVPRRHAELRALVDGRVDAIPVDIGTAVRAGQLLFQVRLSDFETAVAQAEAALARARAALSESEREMGRMQGLFKEGSATEQLRDQAVSAHEQSEAGLQEAEAVLVGVKQSLDDATVRAPYGGVITMRARQRGEYVSRGDVVVEIMDLSILEAEMEVPEPYAGRIVSGLTVDLDVRGGTQDLAGTVVAVNPKIETTTRTFKVKVQVDNPEGKLQAGLFCTGTIQLSAETNRLAIPAAALVTDEGRSSVWIIAAGRVHARQVVADGNAEGFVFVDEGLREGEQVVGGGLGGLYEGAPVSIGPAAASTSNPAGI